jgi:hypothetical protein
MVLADAAQRREFRDAGIDHQDIDPPLFRADPCEDLFEIRKAPCIGAEGADPAFTIARRGVRDAIHRPTAGCVDVRTFGGEAL